jgi:PilZ domain
MMATAEQALTPLASVERRQFQRVRLNLEGRYMLAGRQEYSCRIANMSPGGVALMAAISGRIGERVVAYVDHIGRIEGIIARQLPDGFALSITSSKHKREKFAAQLTWLANRHLLPEQRRHPRIPPRHSSAQLIFPNGVHVTCRVIDISQSGAGIASNQRPTLGSLVTLGKAAARVARYIDDGFAVEFIRLQHPDSLEENVTGG